MLLRLVARLYPNSSPEIIAKEVPELLKRFNADNISKHFLLALLVSPSDHHNGSNLKVRVNRNAERNMVSLEIIGIDNDRALEGSFRVNKSMSGDLQYEILSRTYLFGVKEFLDLPCSDKVKTTLSLHAPHITVARWLGVLLAYAEPYLDLNLYQGNVNERTQQHLFSRMPKEMFDRLTKLKTRVEAQQKLSDSSNSSSGNSRTILKPTLQDLLFDVEPILGRYCQELRIQRGGDPERFVHGLVGLLDGPSILDVVSKQMQEASSDKSAVKKAFGQLRPLADNYLSFLQCYKQFIISYNLLPLHFAASYCPEAIESLISSGAKLDERDSLGRTALDLAISSKNINAVKSSNRILMVRIKERDVRRRVNIDNISF